MKTTQYEELKAKIDALNDAFSEVSRVASAISNLKENKEFIASGLSGVRIELLNKRGQTRNFYMHDYHILFPSVQRKVLSIFVESEADAVKLFNDL